MNENLLKLVIENKKEYSPHIFTINQMNILNKYLSSKKLTYNEKHMLYTSIRKKVRALESIYKEENVIYIYGRDKILSKRIVEAKSLLSKLSGHDRAFIAGSFLFSESYNDIDLFIIQERGYSEEHKDNLHIIKLTENRLKKPIFQSAAKIALSNFPINTSIDVPSLKIKDIMAAYHEAVIEIISHEDKSVVRFLVFNNYLLLQNTLLDGQQLKQITQDITLAEIDKITKDLFKRLFSSTYLYVVLHDYVKSLKPALSSGQNNVNLKRYKALYEELIYESRGSKTATS